MNPAAAAIGLLYWNTSPKRLVGCMVASTVSDEAGVAPAKFNSHSKSWRGRPVQAHTRWRTCTWRVVAASPSRKSG